MQIKQWQYEGLAQFSYAIVSNCEKKIILIDPIRNPQQYLDYARDMDASITGIIETHPHADFVSSHAELGAATGATIYTSSLAEVAYPHTPLYDGSTIELGKIKLTALHTPGHSPDSISILLWHDGRQKAIFSGDTLFIGDCGRPDLREAAGHLKNTKVELAKSMYHTLNNHFLPLEDDVMLYPAHGAGTLCGKSVSNASSSTMGQEKQTNWSLQPTTEAQFASTLLSDQPFVPHYFPFDVELNRKGAAPFKQSIEAVETGNVLKNKSDADALAENLIIIDTRDEKAYKKGHLSNSINLMDGAKFETWLGSIIKPLEKFYLAAESTGQLQKLIERIATIGYEPQIKKAFVMEYIPYKEPMLDIDSFRQNKDDYTIIDVRNGSETKESTIFKNSISIPLPELRNRLNEIPTNKPIVVHCAGGYRSAAASSLIQSVLQEVVLVFDLGEAVNLFQQKH